jgi:PST family polysaccharide transporter
MPRKDFFWRLIQVYLKEGTVFFLFLLSVKLLLPEEFGLYSYVSAFVYFFILMGDFGISATTTKMVAEKKDESFALGKVFASSFIIILLTSIASLLLTLFVAYFFLNEHFYLLWYIAPAIVLAPLVSFYDGFYRGLKNFKLLSQLAIVAATLFALSSLFLVTQYGLKGALFSQNVFYIVFLLGALFVKKPFTLSLDKAVMKEILNYSLIVGIGSIGYFLYAKIDVVILGKFGFLLEAAYYEVITKIFSIGIITFSIFGQVIAPYLIGLRDSQVELAAKIKIYRKKTMLYATGASLLSMVIVPFAINFFLPEYFNQTFLIGFFILAVLLPVDLLAVVQRQGMFVPLGHAKMVTKTVLIGGILNVVSDVVSIYFFGFIGVFVSTLVIHTGVLAYQNKYLHKHFMEVLDTSTR